jgi:hypothetical protein
MVKAVRSFSWPACFELFSSPLKRLVERKGTKSGLANSRNRQGVPIEHTAESGLDFSSLERRNSQHDEIMSILDQVILYFMVPTDIQTAYHSCFGLV